MKLAKFEASRPVLIFSQKRKKQKQVTDYRTRTITTITTDDSWQVALAIPDFESIGRDIKRSARVVSAKAKSMLSGLRIGCYFCTAAICAV